METRERCRVKRYEMAVNVHPADIAHARAVPVDDEKGFWVAHDDYAAMESRALAAEARIREAVETVNNVVMDDDDYYCDCRVCQAVRKTRSILTREVQP